MSKIIQNIYYAVWSLIGLAILVLLAIAILGGDSWVENLNLAPKQDQTQQTAQTAPPQQPAQPTQEQLDCVAEELGEERFAELEQGATAEGDEEAHVIQECLAQ